MGHIPDSLQQTDLYGPSPPLILPMARDRADTKPSGAGNAPSTIRSGLLRRFVFPALTEPGDAQPLHDSPRAIWPDPVDTETAQASVKIADALLRLMPLDVPKIVAITSPSDRDGKTSLVLGIAPQLALRTAGEVLAVDANFHQPDLTSQLKLPATKPTDPSSLVYPTNFPRLSVMPAPHAGETVHWQGSTDGTRPMLPQPGPPYLRSHQFWVEDLREGWPLVLLDMPSLARPETAPLACCCDGVLLVVRLGHTARRAVADASRLIRSSGSRLLGCVTVE